ncbi:MAG: DUF4998 domain-containing protein [Bacteroidota bacterium]
MKKTPVIFSLLLAVLVLLSCSKWDEYKQYTAAGETLYTGKMDSVKIFPGRLRVKINGLLPADPKITKTKITWNSGADSIMYAIVKTSGIDTFSKIVNVPEGIINFKIQNFDAAGNGSVIVNANGTAYGPKYEATLTNRPVATAELQTSGNTIITWDAFDTTTGAKGTWVRFTRTTNAPDSLFVPVGQAVTTFAGLKAGTTISLRTKYLPTPTTIDTFYATAQNRNVKADVTSLYLANTGPGFARATFDGRWGTLGAPWNTNAAAKNKGGINGGYSSDAGGVINWETWGNTPVVNGILYQATSAPLPAGSYTVSFDEYSEIQANSTVYCIAAAGGSGIPVLANLSTALGYVGLYNGAVTGTTGPSATDTRSFTFTLATPQVVSIGFLGNVVGNGNPGSYFQVKRIQLFSN